MKRVNEIIGYTPFPRGFIIELDEKRDTVRTPEHVRFTPQEVLEVIKSCVMKQEDK